MRSTHVRDETFGATTPEPGVHLFVTICGIEVPGDQISKDPKRIDCGRCLRITGVRPRRPR